MDTKQVDEVCESINRALRTVLALMFIGSLLHLILASFGNGMLLRRCLMGSRSSMHMQESQRLSLEESHPSQPSSSGSDDAPAAQVIILESSHPRLARFMSAGFHFLQGLCVVLFFAMSTLSILFLLSAVGYALVRNGAVYVCNHPLSTTDSAITCLDLKQFHPQLRTYQCATPVWVEFCSEARESKENSNQWLTSAGFLILSTLLLLPLSASNYYKFKNSDSAVSQYIMRKRRADANRFIQQAEMSRKSIQRPVETKMNDEEDEIALHIDEPSMAPANQQPKFEMGFDEQDVE